VQLCRPHRRGQPRDPRPEDQQIEVGHGTLASGWC
jgi:hypothetical protein